MGESRRQGREEREAHIKRAKQEVIGHGMRAWQCRGVSAWSSHMEARAVRKESSSRIKQQHRKGRQSKQQAEQNGGGGRLDRSRSTEHSTGRRL